MDRAPARLVALLVVVAVAAAVGALAAGPATGPAAADHGGKSNYTVVPHDRQPGDDRATYQQHAVAPISFEYLDYIGATWAEGGFTGCGATNSEVFAIDRGNDRPGTEYDEDLTQYIEEADVGEDRFYADFYEQDDAIGTSTHLYEGDEFVSVTTDCFDNPGVPGWYRITSDIGGTAPNGTYIEAADVSHYFAVCDCEDRAEAREQLGPPPSEPTPTPTPTARPEPTATRTPPEEGTPFPSPTATETSGRSPTTATGAPGQSGDGSTAGSESSSDGSGGGDGDGDGDGGGGDGGAAKRGDDGTAGGQGTAPTATATTESWDEYANETPSVGAGPGFGPLVAVLGLLVAALLAARR